MIHLYEIIAVLGASAVSAVASHFLMARRLVQNAEHKAVHLVCSECGLLVARFKQDASDAKIRCVNCLRAIEKRL